MIDGLVDDLESNEHVLYYHLGKIGQPLIIMMGSIHGDEPAGTSAIEMLSNHLPIENIEASIVGLCGNKEAVRLKCRYILKDLNRVWSPITISKVKLGQFENLHNEYLEMSRLVDLVEKLIILCQPSMIYYLDMHTTSSDGSVFCILPDDKACKTFAEKMSLPMVHDMLSSLDDTTLHYFSTENLKVPTIAIAFEGGHHKDPFSVYRCFATMMRFISATELVINTNLKENPYDHMLDNYYEKMPHETYVKYRYNIVESRFFEMRPGFRHFSPVKAGEILARYDGKHVTSPSDGHILMPLYQKQGSDGFFIVTENR